MYGYRQNRKYRGRNQRRQEPGSRVGVKRSALPCLLKRQRISDQSSGGEKRH